jgi:hypothetical protein
MPGVVEEITWSVSDAGAVCFEREIPFGEGRDVQGGWFDRALVWVLVWTLV